MLQLNTAILTFNVPKADNKIYICKISKNVLSELYQIENSKI